MFELHRSKTVFVKVRDPQPISSIRFLALYVLYITAVQLIEWAMYLRCVSTEYLNNALRKYLVSATDQIALSYYYKFILDLQ